MANEPTEMVRVKPLQWKKTSPDRWEADTSIGPYHVMKMPDDTYEVCDPIRCRILDCDEAAALVWCQADYELRIITALTADKLEPTTPASHLSPDAYAENVRRQREIIRKSKE